MTRDASGAVRDPASEVAIDPARCPRCGNANACVMAAGAPEAACWCESVVVPFALLDALPGEAKGAACLCASCIEAASTS